jgi:hypothetical protein
MFSILDAGPVYETFIRQTSGLLLVSLPVNGSIA